MKRGALIGCGFFSYNHLHAWQQLEGVEIVALCDRDTARLAQAAQDFGIARTYTDAGELFAREQLDFVDIATTVHTHRALVELAAAARVPCICQKPFAPTLDDALAMVAACAAASVPLMVHENFRWQTPVQAARRVLDSGAIGTPFWGRFSFRSAFDVYRTQPYLAQGQRFIIEDLGIHVLDIARFLLGDVTTLNATTQRVNPRIAGEDVATMLMRHASGATSVVDCSYASPRAEELFPQTLLEIDGSDGSLRVDAGYRLHVYSRSGVQSTQNCEPPLHAWAQRPWFNIQDSVLNIQAHWLDCLATGCEPQTSGRDNLRTLALVEAAYRSAGSGQQAVSLSCDEGR
ncbi:Gfo/Idh/MocA family protein [Roseateles sp. DC23W]|uniref:Gfo/Idh/MocA family protein n=1 Tax=Pelomonas dachongensis TaxID=3299029 RepID=A0ABW7ESA1_9BURK